MLSCVLTLAVSLQKGSCQYLPYMPLTYAPFLPPPPPLLFPSIQFCPVPYPTLPGMRAPHATIILSTGITAVSPTTGTLVIGAPTVVTPTTVPTVVSTAVPTVTTAAPAPLISILGILYASALYESPLSVANPLLFAYLSSLTI
ncbi:MAG: hypothetical protein AB1611_06050 [bacterium]